MPIFFRLVKYMIYGTFADCPVPYSFKYPDTEHYLRHYLTWNDEKCNEKTVSVTEQEFLDWKAFGRTVDGFGEFCLLCEQTSEFLLPKNRCVFHAVALSYHGDAWLLAAGSGVGKSTICRAMIEKYPNEISVINGDKPVLRVNNDGSITVFPSPWTGKEGWQGAPAAKLSGIILLRRGSGTAIREANSAEAAHHVLLSIFQSFTDEAMIRLAGTMAEKILKAVPSWVLVEDNVSNAVELFYQTMKETHKNDI